VRLLAFDPGDVLVTALGADDWADLFAERRRVRTVHVEGDRVDVATELRSAGLGLRVARGRDVRMA
jgi:predicted Zn-dependent protease